MAIGGKEVEMVSFVNKRAKYMGGGDKNDPKSLVVYMKPGNKRITKT